MVVKTHLYGGQKCDSEIHRSSCHVIYGFCRRYLNPINFRRCTVGGWSHPGVVILVPVDSNPASPSYTVLHKDQFMSLKMKDDAPFDSKTLPKS